MECEWKEKNADWRGEGWSEEEKKMEMQEKEEEEEKWQKTD